MKELVTSKMEEIETWSAGELNLVDFCGVVQDWYERSGTAFAAAFYGMTRYELAVELMYGLEVDEPDRFAAPSTERPAGIDDVRELMSSDGAEEIFSEILRVSRAEYRAAKEQVTATPPTYLNRLLERWTASLRAALTAQTLRVQEMSDWCEGEYMRYYEALRRNEQGRAWERYSDDAEGLMVRVFEERHLRDVMNEYGLREGAPEGLKEMMCGDEE